MNPFTQGIHQHADEFVSSGWKTLSTLLFPLRSRCILKRYQQHNLQAMIQYAARHVPYYRDLFKQTGIKPEAIKTADDLKQIPVTTKADLLAIPYASRIPEGIDSKQLHTFTTSGTTGRPLTVATTKMDATINQALMLRVLRHYKMKPWHSKLSVKGVVTQSRDTSWHARLGLFRRGWIAASMRPEEWVQELQSFNPDYILGYCSTLQLMARALQSTPNHHIKPRGILSTSGVLGTAARQEITTGFSAPVYDVYASWEGGIMAWECRLCGAYHVNSDQVIIEILRDGIPVAPGEEGEAVITNLHSRGMPFIRYSQGDILVRGDNQMCPLCLPTLKEIHGRTADMLTLPSGEKMSPHSLFVIIDRTPGIDRWRMIQPTPSVLRLQLLPKRTFDEIATSELQQDLQALLGPEVECKIEHVEALPYTPNQKYRLLVAEHPA